MVYECCGMQTVKAITSNAEPHVRVFINHPAVFLGRHIVGQVHVVILSVCMLYAMGEDDSCPSDTQVAGLHPSFLPEDKKPHDAL